MTQAWHTRSCRGRILAVVVALACVVGVQHVPAADAQSVDTDPEVIAARQRIARARALVEQLSVQLDAAAASYENANAHALRMAEELDANGVVVGRAEQRAAEAERAFADQVAHAYMRPDADVALAGAVALAPDASTALHRAALLARITLAERARADRAQQAVVATQDAGRQQQIIRAGALAAADDRQRLAEELTVGLGNAEHQVRQATSELSDAEAQAARRIEEERRRAAAAARVAAIAAMGNGPLPPIDGKVCPLGAPNAFIDSWGFPRSGGRRHQGVDMFAAYGMPLYAVADGTVTRVYNNRLGGLSIDLIDDAGDRYYYAHLSAAAATSGQRVSAGQVIGANGDSGNARGTPPHLHWQYHPGNGPPVNPYPLARALCRGG